MDIAYASTARTTRGPFVLESLWVLSHSEMSDSLVCKFSPRYECKKRRDVL
jgi:hypothetical protein